MLANVVPRLFPRLPWPTGTPPLALVADLCARTVSLDEPHEPAALDAPRRRRTAPRHPHRPDSRLLGCCWRGSCSGCSASTYDAAISTSGYFGLALGATPTAIAVMTAITKAHGASPRSFIVVPLVGAFFVDIANAITIQTIIGLLGRYGLPSRPGRAPRKESRRANRATRLAQHCEKTAGEGFPSLGIAL